MANWKDILNEINKDGSTFDIVRRRYLKKLNNYTKRNVIAYYSGWLQKNSKDLVNSLGINDYDKNGFMTTINGLNTDIGLDLILHTPGGEVAATESIIDYLQKKFSDIRVIVPQLAMSAGTMIACSSDTILMGKQSSLGPIDPQYRGLPAHGIIEEFNKAYEEIKVDQSKIFVWRSILEKYTPTLLGECEKSIDWAEDIVKTNLKNRMFKEENDTTKNNKIKRIIKELGDHSINLSHARHIPLEKCKDLGLKIEALEDDQKLQDLVLNIHFLAPQHLKLLKIIMERL
jgi:ClpP class serine protease